jgi:hypothetical protein
MAVRAALRRAVRTVAFAEAVRSASKLELTANLDLHAFVKFGRKCMRAVSYRKRGILPDFCFIKSASAFAKHLGRAMLYWAARNIASGFK